MNSLPENLTDDPVLLKQMLGQMLDERQLDKGKIVRLEEQNALLLQRLFRHKSEQQLMRQRRTWRSSMK